MLKKDISVLLIEDDPMVQQVNQQFIERVKGFKVISSAKNGNDGIQKIKKLKPDLIILDIFMPTLGGIEVLQQIRYEKIDIDVIVISAANDRHTIRTMLQNGVIDYIIKPFKFERIKQSLHNYKLYLKRLEDDSLSQSQLDKMLFLDNSKVPQNLIEIELPKGLNKSTLTLITTYLSKQHESKSAEEVAEGVGLVRVTARRYLEYLKEQGSIEVEIQYGVIGRPINRYIMLPKQRMLT